MRRDVRFDAKVFSVDAVKRSAYRFLDRFVADITIADDVIDCQLRFGSGKSDVSVDNCVDDFKKEVLDQDLRERIKTETESVRNLILAHAFSRVDVARDE